MPQDKRTIESGVEGYPGCAHTKAAQSTGESLEGHEFRNRILEIETSRELTFLDKRRLLAEQVRAAVLSAEAEACRDDKEARVAVLARLAEICGGLASGVAKRRLDALTDLTGRIGTIRKEVRTLDVDDPAAKRSLTHIDEALEQTANALAAFAVEIVAESAGTAESEYKYLEARPGSQYRQLFVKGRRIRAIVLNNETKNSEPRTAEEVAADYNLPVEAVLEAIDYCERYPEVIAADCQMELDSIRAEGLDKPPYVPPDFKPDS